MTIRDAIQEKWDTIRHKSPNILSIFPCGKDPGQNKGMFEKSIGLVVRHFQDVMAKGENKSSLLLIAPPYRRQQVLECVLRILISSETERIEFMAPEEIQQAWRDKTQVMMCFKTRNVLRWMAYTPVEDDIVEGRYWFHYEGRQGGRLVRGRKTFNPYDVIMLKPQSRIDREEALPDDGLCDRKWEKLIRELRLSRAIVIIGKKCDKTVDLLRRKWRVGGKSVWDAFSATELTEHGLCRPDRGGGFPPSIIVANDYGRLNPYFETAAETAEGRYDKFHCIICDDHEEVKKNGTDGMKDQIVIRSSESIVRDYFDDPATFKGRYNGYLRDCCLFVWDRHLDADLQECETSFERDVTIIDHLNHDDIWKNLPGKIKSLMAGSPQPVADVSAIRKIYHVYRQLMLPAFDVAACQEVLSSISSNVDAVIDIVKDLEIFLKDSPNGETEKMLMIKSWVEQHKRNRLSVLSGAKDDPSALRLIEYGSTLGIQIIQDSNPALRPVSTIAFRKRATKCANRHWLFADPSVDLHWFLFREEFEELMGLNDFLDEIETHVMPREMRAKIIGVAPELLHEHTTRGDRSDCSESNSPGIALGHDSNYVGDVQFVEDEPLEDAIKRYLLRDSISQIRPAKEKSNSRSATGVRVRFADHSMADFFSSRKVLVEDQGKRFEVEAVNVKPGQRVYFANESKVNDHVKNKFGDPKEAVNRWRSVLLRLLQESKDHVRLASILTSEVRAFGLDEQVSVDSLRRWGRDKTRLPFDENRDRARRFFQSLGVVGKDDELANEDYAKGLAALISDVNNGNRGVGRNFANTMRTAWLEKRPEVEDCFAGKLVNVAVVVDGDDILTEE